MDVGKGKQHLNASYRRKRALELEEAKKKKAIVEKSVEAHDDETIGNEQEEESSSSQDDGSKDDMSTENESSDESSEDDDSDNGSDDGSPKKLAMVNPSTSTVAIAPPSITAPCILKSFDCHIAHSIWNKNEVVKHLLTFQLVCIN